MSSLRVINENRNNVALEFISTLQKSNVFIFTCGLTECCKQRVKNLAIAPGLYLVRMILIFPIHKPQLSRYGGWENRKRNY